MGYLFSSHTLPLTILITLYYTLKLSSKHGTVEPTTGKTQEDTVQYSKKPNHYQSMGAVATTDKTQEEEQMTTSNKDIGNRKRIQIWSYTVKGNYR